MPPHTVLNLFSLCRYVNHNQIENFFKTAQKIVPLFTYHRCHEKTSYVSNYAFFTLMYKWVDIGQIHHFEQLQNYTSSDEIGITHRGVFTIGESTLYRPIHAIQ